MSFFRYPGGKKKINDIIQKNIYNVNVFEYREPFFGGGSVGLLFFQSINPFFTKIKKVWINDIDKSLYCLWKSIIDNPDELKNKIISYVPHVNDFYDFKAQLLSLNDIEDIIDIGFKKLVIHQISYSGLGTKSGGPLGGKEQKSKYKIDCRWSVDYLCKKIDNIHNSISKINIKCTCFDFSKLLENINDDIIIYLDPPYYIKGDVLYQESFKVEDHIRLSNILKNIKCKWVLSYDYCDEIIDLYNWANLIEIPIKYTIKGSRDKKELLISNRKLIQW